MNLLIYVDPLHQLGNPFFHLPWLGFTDQMARSLIRFEERAEVVCITSYALSSAYQSQYFKTVVIDHSDLVPTFGVSAAEVSRLWNQGGSAKANLKMTALIMEVLPEGFIPDVSISFSPAPFLKTAHPQSPTLFFELGMLSRSPFKHTAYLDPFDSFRAATFLRMETQIKARQLSLDEASVLCVVREACQSALYPSPYSHVFKTWRAKFSKVVLLCCQFSNFYSFDCYTGHKTQLDLVIDVLTSVPRDVGVVVSEHPNHKFLTTEIRQYLQEKYQNFLWDELFEDIGEHFSHMLMANVDAVVTVSSKTGIESLIWKKPLITVGNSPLRVISDSNDLADLVKLDLSKWPEWKENFLAWFLTRYYMPTPMMYETPLFVNKLRSAVSLHDKSAPERMFEESYADLSEIFAYYKKFTRNNWPLLERCTPSNFDEQAYLIANPDLSDSKKRLADFDCLNHLLNFGMREARNQLIDHRSLPTSYKKKKADLLKKLSSNYDEREYWAPQKDPSPFLDIESRELALECEEDNLERLLIDAIEDMRDQRTLCIMSAPPLVAFSCAIVFGSRPQSGFDVHGSMQSPLPFVEEAFDNILFCIHGDELRFSKLLLINSLRCLKLGGRLLISPGMSTPAATSSSEFWEELTHLLDSEYLSAPTQFQTKFLSFRKDTAASPQNNTCY